MIHLSGGDYEAWVSPRAGGRLCRLVWHGPQGDRELLVPTDANKAFDAHAWPKQGAFPMLPYANRLADARFDWYGHQCVVHAEPGQSHGLHGLGHRQAWEAIGEGTDHVTLCLRHLADEEEWPWSFTAELSYRVAQSGLHIALAVRNDSAVPAPVILGWHPYVPRQWMANARSSGIGKALHDLGSEGLKYPDARADSGSTRPVVMDLQVPHTLTLQDWSAPWILSVPGGGRWCLESDAANIVHHVPPSLGYVAIEPVTALPGSLRSSCAAAQIALASGQWRRLNCRLHAS